MTNQFFKIIPHTQSMQEFARELACQCPQGTVVFLTGELGVGKTTFVQGFLQAFGYQGVVKSPTYTLVEGYHLNQTIYHFDLYRLVHPKELLEIGLEEYFNPHNICLIEWPEKGKPYLPLPDLVCFIEYHLHNQRKLCLIAMNEKGEKILKHLSE